MTGHSIQRQGRMLLSGRPAHSHDPPFPVHVRRPVGV